MPKWIFQKISGDQQGDRVSHSFKTGGLVSEKFQCPQTNTDLYNIDIVSYFKVVDHVNNSYCNNERIAFIVTFQSSMSLFFWIR